MVFLNFIPTPKSFYIAFTIFLVSIGVHLFYFSHFRETIKESKSQRLFDWLDNKNDKNIVREIIGEDIKKDADILINLEVTQKRLLTYVKYNKNKLILIRALMKTMNNNYLTDLYFRLFIPIIATIIIGSFSNPIFTKLMFGENTKIPFVDNEIITAIKGVFFLVFILTSIALSIFQIHKGQRRNKLFEELIETCIQKVEDEYKTKK
jgi:mRNA-degrading endonuclease HigB of HigAB toxin-antitoxin module